MQPEQGKGRPRGKRPRGNATWTPIQPPLMVSNHAQHWLSSQEQCDPSQWGPQWRGKEGIPTGSSRAVSHRLHGNCVWRGCTLEEQPSQMGSKLVGEGERYFPTSTHHRNTASITIDLASGSQDPKLMQ